MIEYQKTDIHFLVLDVDGTLTDGKIYMGQDGELLKAFDIKDGCGIKDLLPKMEIVPIIITARESKILQNRCNELNIQHLHQGERNKLDTLNRIITNYNKLNKTDYDLQNCAYVGDDLLDIPCMKAIKENGGIAACPADAVSDVKSICDYISSKEGGKGAVREFIDWLRTIEKQNSVQKLVNKALLYLQKLEKKDLKEGKYEVDSNFCYSVQRYNTKNVTDCQFESHKQYIDIQLMVEGSEIMDIADIARLSVKNEYDEKKDIMFWNEPKVYSRCSLQPNDYIIVYPEHAHRGAVCLNKQCNVLKIVGKIKV